MTAAADRHLLFGLLALQNGIINQAQLVAAFQAWTLNKSQSLADHLEFRGDLTTATRALLEGLAEVHLGVHGGDVERSLAAVSAGKSTRESLALSAARRSTRRSATSALHMVRPRTAISIARHPTPSDRPPATASGSASCVRTPAAGWGPSSWRSTPS